MPFINLGRKPTEPISASKETKQPDMYFPSFYIDDKNLPFDEKDVGKEVIAEVKLKLKSMEKRMNEKRKTDSVSFDVIEISFSKNSKRGHYAKGQE